MGATTDDTENNAVESGRPVIYTVGTSTRSREEFLALLRAYGIKAVLDVRRFPTNRRYPHFSRASLASWLAASGITYHYLGDSLGGYRREGYEAYSGTPAFRRGLEEATEVAARGRAAIMCCERLPWRCHRRFIARHLAALGWQVVHILDQHRTYLQPTPQPPRAHTNCPLFLFSEGAHTARNLPVNPRPPVAQQDHAGGSYPGAPPGISPGDAEVVAGPGTACSGGRPVGDLSIGGRRRWRG